MQRLGYFRSGGEQDAWIMCRQWNSAPQRLWNPSFYNSFDKPFRWLSIRKLVREYKSLRPVASRPLVFFAFQGPVSFVREASPDQARLALRQVSHMAASANGSPDFMAMV